MNHPRNVAIVHPVMFTLRRIFYALSIVLIASVPLLGVWIMLFGTVIMLAYALSEWQWSDKLINIQHIFNETVTYLVCVYLLLFTNFVDAEMRVTLGYFLLGVFVCFLAFNVVIMLIMLCRKLIRLLRKCITKKRRHKLKQEATNILQSIKKLLETKQKEKKDWFAPDELDYVWEPIIHYKRGGGASCRIV